jgi:raffinose/stachyose/melibiose transport system substrate-binding protein
MKLRILLVLVLLLMFSGCVTPALAPTTTQESEQQIRLLIWDQHGGEADVAATEIVNNFMAMHPNITVEREIVPYEQIQATARTALASGTGPDIVYIDVTPARELFRAGLLLPLNEFADQYGWKDRFFPAGLEWTIVNDQIIGLGLEYEFVGVFVNKTLMNKEGFDIPETLDEVLSFCQAARERGYIPFAHGQNPGWQTFFSFTMPLNNLLGVENIEKLVLDKEGRWDTPEVERAIEVFHIQMRDAGCFVEDVNGFDFQNQLNAFYTGEALMLPTGTWALDGINTNMPEDVEVIMVPFMAIEEGGERVYTAGMGSAYFISSASEHPQEAAMFLDYVFSEEAARIWVETAGVIPPVRFNSADLDIPSLTKFTLNTLTEAGEGAGDLRLGYNVDLLTSQEFNTIMRSGFQAVMAGLKTPQEQAADLQATWERQLAEEAE